MKPILIFLAFVALLVFVPFQTIVAIAVWGTMIMVVAIFVFMVLMDLIMGDE